MFDECWVLFSVLKCIVLRNTSYTSKIMSWSIIRFVRCEWNYMHQWTEFIEFCSAANIYWILMNKWINLGFLCKFSPSKVDYSKYALESYDSIQDCVWIGC